MRHNDEELVRLHLQGENHAFRELVNRYTRPIYNLAYRFTGDRTEAEDIAQETLVRVYRALPNSRLDLPFRPWLFRIAVNLCHDWAKKKQSPTFSVLEEMNDEKSLFVEEIPDSAPLPLERVETEEMAEMVRQVVMELPEPYRVAITLRYTEGLSYQEMAAVLGLPLNTVRTHLFRAKRLLRQAVERYLGGEL